ncbi:MAG TPA: Gfo/Idh/MocA family oxidoreductase [Alphaproteobacteria bacterium]|nr:Gfo/Idh/MocA family oxidoreductase [Alphaproteobacteria bacterium]
MKFLVCGLGSIGQRHVRVLRSLLGDEATIYVHRKRGLDIVINDDMTAIQGRDPVAHYGLIDEPSFERALERELDAVLVTNPISMHVETALAAAERGHNLFIEKPLGASLDGVERLESLVARSGLVTHVGYQLRFHPALRLMRELLQEGAIGDPIAAEVHFGEWLPGMHPYEDYRTSHAARRDQGGGAILCLSHDIDYATWLFGLPRVLFAVGGKLSDLEMDVEDTASILMQCGASGRPVPVQVHVDFVQRVPRRFCRIAGTRGTIAWDYHRNQVTIVDAAGNETERSFPGWQRNDMFRAQMAHFIACLGGAERPQIPVSAGAATLRVCLAAKQSLETGKAVTL